jgi:hypothetical protein
MVRTRSESGIAGPIEYGFILSLLTIEAPCVEGSLERQNESQDSRGGIDMKSDKVRTCSIAVPVWCCCRAEPTAKGYDQWAEWCHDDGSDAGF